MRVAVGGEDRRSGLARLRRALDMAGAEGEGLPAAAVEDDRALAQSRRLDARDRPGVGPGPGLRGAAGRERLRKGALEQDLRENRLGLDPSPWPNRTTSGREERGGREPRPPRRFGAVSMAASIAQAAARRRPMTRRREARGAEEQPEHHPQLRVGRSRRERQPAWRRRLAERARAGPPTLASRRARDLDA